MKNDILDYLESHDLDYRDSEDKVQCQCINPAHDDINASAYFDLIDMYYHCSSCGYHLNQDKLYNLLNIEFSELDRLRFSLNKSNKIKEYATPFLPLKHKDFTMSFRGISSEVFSKIGAYVTPKENFYSKRLIIPYYNVYNKVMGFEGYRLNDNIEPKTIRQKGIDTSRFFVFENLIDQDEVYLCEGIFSALSFHQIGKVGLANLGVASIEDKINCLYQKGVKKVILCGDNDEVGRKWNIESYYLLRKSFEVSYFKYAGGTPDKYDANDLLRDGLLE